MVKKTIVIIGGGLGGMSAGWQIAKAGLGKVIILEKNSYTGGICNTVKWDKFKSDLGPHKMFSLLPGVMKETLSMFKKKEIIKHKKKNRIFLMGNYINYPIGLMDIIKVMGIKTIFAIGMSLIATKLGNMFHKKQEKSYEDYVVKRFGRKLYNIVFEPLASKVWGKPHTLSSDMAKTRIAASNAIEVLLEAIGLKKKKKVTSATHFYYPKKGFAELPGKLEQQIKNLGGKIKTNVTNIKLQAKGDKIIQASWSISGKKEKCVPDLIISAFPLQELPQKIKGHNFTHTINLVKQLELRHTLLVFLSFDKEQLLNDHWIFVPDKDIIFSRIYEPKMLSKEMAPSNRTMICCDLTSAENSKIWKMSDKELSMKCCSGLKKMCIINKDEKLKGHKVIRVKNFYPRYGIGYKERVDKIIEQVSKISNIICTGRLGMYNYNNFDHCMHMGMVIAKELKAGIKASDICRKLLDISFGYRIVD